MNSLREEIDGFDFELEQKLERSLSSILLEQSGNDIALNVVEGVDEEEFELLFTYSNLEKIFTR